MPVMMSVKMNYVKDLPWRADNIIIKEFISDLDKHLEAKISAQAKPQTKSRVPNACISVQQAPVGMPSWALNQSVTTNCYDTK